MRIPKSIFFIIIAIIMGLIIFLLASPDASKTYSSNKTFVAEQTSTTEETSSQTKTVAEILTSVELKLFGYYVILFKKDFRDILTENDVQAIIDELKKFPPTDIDKLVHHQEEMLIHANNIKIEIEPSVTEEHGYLKQYYVTYQAGDSSDAHRVEFSPTIDAILLRAKTEHPDIYISYYPDFATNPLFMQLAFTSNNNIIPLIQLFLDNGVAINARHPNSNKTIFTTVGTLEIAQFLLNNGADPTILTDDNDTPLMFAVSWERSNELIKLLIDLGVDLHAKSSFYGTALGAAKEGVKGLESSIWRTHETDDESPGDELLPARLEKAEEVVRIIEQALEADKKSAK
ncbi:MAG: ankyrin repeat domain-containing protein [Alphaproteobacteria bacterium]|nr:ankyrin repeat domain-containing protein [Alphaproteobacteria bacterium]